MRNKLRLVTASLLLLSSAVFAIGAALEHHIVTESRAESSHVGSENGAAQEKAGEGGQSNATDNSQGEHSAATFTHTTAAEQGASTEAGGKHEAAMTEAHSETLLGVNPEAIPLVVIAVLISVLFAAALLSIGSSVLAAILALVMLALVALDIREIIHQLDESRTGLATLPATVALLHTLVAVAAFRISSAARLVNRSNGPSPTSP